MARISKSPGTDPARLERMLQRLRSQRTDAPTTTAPAGPGGPTDAFVPSGGGPAAPTFIAPVARRSGPPALGALGAQMLAMQGGTRVGPTRKAGAHGLEIHGSVTVETRASLERIAGAVTIMGDLSISEAALDGVDWSALSTLAFVEGHVGIEANDALTDIAFLATLQKVGGALFIGDNPSLAEANLPRLADVGRGLIFEGNASLVRISVPVLESLGGYLHVHDNATLKSVSLPVLQSLGGELSILDNPRLQHMVTGELGALDDVELDRGARSVYDGASAS